MSQHLSEQEIIRRDKLKELAQLGIDPYPAASYPVFPFFYRYKGTVFRRNKRSERSQVRYS